MEKDNRKDTDHRREKAGQTKPGEDASFLGEENVASANECTGLMPSLPSTEEEAESYADLYTVPAPPQKKDDGHRGQNGTRSGGNR